MRHLITGIWLVILGAVITLLALPGGRAVFEAATHAHPYLMGMGKIGLLGTMGELQIGRAHV